MDHVTATAGAANGERVRRWFRDKKAGWYAVLGAPQMPVTSTLLDQAPNTIERKLCAMTGFHHPGGVTVQVVKTGITPQRATSDRLREAETVPLHPAGRLHTLQ